MTPRRRRTLAILAPLALLVAGYALLVRPRLDRDWKEDEARLATATFHGDTVAIHNVRNFDYQSTDQWTPRWEERTYDLSQLESAWFIVEPFSTHRGPAHTFVSFGFKDGRYLAMSVEIRKEKGESFDPFKALFRKYELYYVAGDERDLVRLRSNYRKDSVFVYKVATEPAKARALLEDMLQRANTLAVRPEFYNTLTSTCTTNLVAHVNRIAPKRVPFSYKVLLPAFADELAYDVGLLDTTVAFPELRRRALINARAAAADTAPDFSARIRA
jgi:hypothetical protein